MVSFNQCGDGQYCGSFSQCGMCLDCCPVFEDQGIIGFVGGYYLAFYNWPTIEAAALP